MKSPNRLQTLAAVLFFPVYYCWEIVVGALRISFDVFHPRPRLAPVLVRVPLEELSPRQRLLLANLVTMTPGTLAVDLLEDDWTLVVHGLYNRDRPEELVATIKERYQPVVARLPI
jgi:multicomponent Na+:H+ antiporter subunit E